FLATLNLLAFLTHTVLEWLDEAYRAVRNAAPSRRTFFEQFRILLQFMPFDNWQHLMRFMLYGENQIPRKT
ncbi:MAG: ISNCY family transposase, partial [Methylomicrobium sp.]|nr:ISNCY family transposase [Methylomicrobium sp.]MBS3953363.1 ISNCY family transposase [Methylomicrobium sp.]